MGCHFLLQEIFPTQALNLDLLHCKHILYHLSHQGSPYVIYILPQVFKMLETLKYLSLWLKYEKEIGGEQWKWKDQLEDCSSSCCHERKWWLETARACAPFLGKAI